jgi:hypothetical protein
MRDPPLYTGSVGFQTAVRDTQDLRDLYGMSRLYIELSVSDNCAFSHLSPSIGGMVLGGGARAVDDAILARLYFGRDDAEHDLTDSLLR